MNEKCKICGRKNCDAYHPCLDHEECNNCDLPVTTPNPGGYCDECLAEAMGA